MDGLHSYVVDVGEGESRPVFLTFGRAPDRETGGEAPERTSPKSHRASAPSRFLGLST